MIEKRKNLIFLILIVTLIIVLCVLLKIALGDNKKDNMFQGMNSEKNSSDVEELTSSVALKEKRGEESYSDYTAKIDLGSLSIEGDNVKINDTEITISKEGTYYFSGTAEEANIVVNADENVNVVLVFDNANITSSKTACINGINAKNIYINLVKDSTNTFTDSSEYTKFTEDDEPDATIFSKTDLFINGKGKLIVNANYKDAITSKDDLVITNSNIEINSKDDGIKGKDSVDIKDAKIKIVAANEAIKSTNEEDTDKGYVILENVNSIIEAGDDGIHAETDLILNNCDIEIDESEEGIEGKLIIINDGNIKVYSDDDAINATDGNGSTKRMGETTEGVQLQIHGGKVYVNSDGDGLDSNGDIIVTGGNIAVAGSKNGGNNALDYDGTFKITGGDLVAYGADGMWQNPSNCSTIYSICFKATGNIGDEVVIKDSNGSEVTNFKIDKDYGVILYTSDKLQKGEKYTLFVNNTEVSTIEVQEIVNSEVSEGMF